MLVINLLSEETHGADVTWLLWVALGFFAIMVVVGWLVSLKKKPEEPEKHEKKEEHH